MEARYACVGVCVFGPPLNSEMCWLSLIWDEVHFVPKRCLLLPAVLLGIMGYSNVCLLHRVLLTVCLIPSTFSCSPDHQGWQEMAPMGTEWHQPTMTCITGQLGLAPPPMLSWPSPYWLLSILINHWRLCSPTSQHALREKETEFSCKIIWFHQLCWDSWEELEVWSYEADTPTIPGVFKNPYLEKDGSCSQ